MRRVLLNINGGKSISFNFAENTLIQNESSMRNIDEFDLVLTNHSERLINGDFEIVIQNSKHPENEGVMWICLDDADGLWSQIPDNGRTTYIHLDGLNLAANDSVTIKMGCRMWEREMTKDVIMPYRLSCDNNILLDSSLIVNYENI